MAQGTVVKRGSKYVVRYRDLNGVQRSKSIGTNKREAERARIDIMSRINQNEWSDSGDIGFTDFTELWLNDYARHLAPTTQAEYSGYIKKYLIPFFENRSLASIRPTMCQTFISELEDRGDIGPKMIWNICVPLRRMFEIAIEWEMLRRNPAARLRKPKLVRKEMKFYTPKEARALLAELEGRDKVLFLVALGTGMRQGEILGLTRSCVDLEKAIISVKWKMTRKGEFERPKSDAGIRDIPIGPGLVAALTAHLQAAPASEQDLVFCTDTGTRLCHSNIDRRVFAPAAERAGIKKIRFHDLRHTFACWLISEDSANIKYIQRVMGHASISITYDRYGHLLPTVGADIAVRHETQLFGDDD